MRRKIYIVVFLLLLATQLACNVEQIDNSVRCAGGSETCQER